MRIKKENVNSFLLLLIVLQLTVVTNAQITQTIRGTIVDKHTKMTLPGASISIQHGDDLNGVITDANGLFTMDNIEVGRHTITVSFIGYNSQTLENLVLNSGKELVLNIELEEKVEEIEGIVVTAHKKHKPVNEMATLSARSFTVEETQKYAGTRNDPSRMAANYAGVMASGDQRNDIIIRGNSPLGLLWRMNGVNIPNPNHFGGMGTTGGPISMINSKTLQNSDFYTGAFPSEFGNALSGVFDLKMRNGNRWNQEYMAQISFDGMEMAMEGPFSKSNNNATYMVNYRYSTWEIVDAMGISFGPSAIPKYQDASFKVDLFKTKLGKFSLWGFGGANNIAILESEKDAGDWSYGKSASDKYLNSQTGVIALSHLYFFNNNTRIETNISCSGYTIEQKRDSLNLNMEVFPVYRNNSSEISYTFSTKLKKKFNVKNHANIGLTYDLYNVSYSDSIYHSNMKSFMPITDISNKYLGLLQTYIQWRHRFSDNLEMYSGLHYQYFDLNKKQSIEPRFNLSYKLTSNQSIGISYGLHSQLQPRYVYFNTELETSPGTYITSNENMDFSKAHHFVLGYDNLIGKNFRAKAEVYYQKLYNIPVDNSRGYYSLVNSGDFFRVYSTPELVNDGTGESYGLEITLEKFFSNNYYFLLTNSLFQSTYKGSDRIKRNTAFNGNYVLNILGGYEFSLKNNKTLNLDINTSYAGGKRYIPVDEEASITSTVYDYDRAYKMRYPNYFRTDFKVSYKINRPKTTYSLSLDVQNITNHKNIFSHEYDFETGEYITDYQQGLFPIFQLRVEF